MRPRSPLRQDVAVSAEKLQDVLNAMLQRSECSPTPACRPWTPTAGPLRAPPNPFPGWMLLVPGNTDDAGQWQKIPKNAETPNDKADSHQESSARE